MKLIVIMWVLVFCLCNSAIGNVSIEDDKTLFIYLKKYAQQGNPWAQYYLGMMYNNGLGTGKDPKKAFGLFREAAASGDPLGAFKIGCYFAGQFKVVAVDLSKALEYKLISANAGYVLAQDDVGFAYYHHGDFDKALKWWTAAANQGYPRALYKLSMIYGEGKIVPKDYTLSYAYLKLSDLASENRITPETQAKLDLLTDGMSSTELAKAEEMVSKWKPNLTALTIKAFSGIKEAKKLVEVFESYPSSIDSDLVGVWVGDKTQKDGTKKKWKQIRSEDGSYVISFGYLESNGDTYEWRNFGRWWVEDGLFNEIVPSTSSVKQPDVYKYEFYNKGCLRFNQLSRDEHEGYTFTECRSNVPPVATGAVDDRYLNDQAAILTMKQRADLARTLADHNRKGHGVITVHTLRKLPLDVSIEDYAFAKINEGASSPNEKAGRILLVVAMENRKLRIETTESVSAILSDEYCNEVIDNLMVLQFKQSQYFAGIRAGIDALIERLAQ